MKMNFKRFLMTMFLLPIFPIISIPEGDSGGGSNGGDDGSPDGGNNDGDNNNNDGNTGNPSGSKNNSDGDDQNSGQVVFKSQDEFNSVIERRIAKATKKAREEYEKERKKESLSEVEKLKLEKEEAEKLASERAAASDKKLVKAEVISQSAKLKIIDSDAAYALIPKDDIEVLDDGTVTGVEKALKVLIKSKPWLLSTTNQNPKPGGDDQNSGSGKNKSFSMNALIRRAAGLD
jgi:hypothetical protein